MKLELQTLGGIQIDVFPAYDTNVTFSCNDRTLNLYKSASQLGLRPGTIIEMVPDKAYL